MVNYKTDSPAPLQPVNQENPAKACSPDPAGFVHLHVHTQYSLLDGTIRLDRLFAKCKEYGMEAVAMTDHGSMFGALEFYLEAKKAGIKPIVGCEFYVAAAGRYDRNSKGANSYHLVLLAMDYQGYQNLMKLASIAQLEGFHYKPRIDMEVLEAHSEGLIALTACLHGEVPYLLAKGEKATARAKLDELARIFPDRLYLELQENGIEEQKIANQGLIELAQETGLPLVATNDCHHLNRDESYAHELLLCIQTGKTINDPQRFCFSTDEFYFKSPAEMKSQFAYIPQAITETTKIAERCNLEIDLGAHHFPDFPVPPGETLENLFASEAREGLKKRFDEFRRRPESFPSEQEGVYQERLEHEIEVINKMGFPGYFLIVADYVNWAKSKSIPVGPGRGSSAGSLVAYAMRITDIDPIPYGLIFERFLNKERKSIPDFDVDFCQDRRNEVMEYVHEKYGGSEYVVKIVTHHPMKTEKTLRDVGKAMDMPQSDVEELANLLPVELNMTIDKAVKSEPKLAERMKIDPQVNELLKAARVLEGLNRDICTHAAGLLISPKPIVEYLPVFRGCNENEVLSQYDAAHAEKAGVVRFDFLGLKTLTVIDRTLKLINTDRGIEVDIAAIPMDDNKTYELLSRGDTQGVFLFDSPGMRKLLSELKPEVFSDLIALLALYRPGPLQSGMVNDFIETKHGRMAARYPLPQLEPILKETYGVIVYLEQVMLIANVFAGYSLDEAYRLRYSLCKTTPEVMSAEKDKFITGCRKNGIDEKKADYVFELIAKFTAYSFIKSHSAAYALIAYQTAWLKSHYPAQFMAVLLAADKDSNGSEAD